MTAKNKIITVEQLRLILDSLGTLGEVDCFIQTPIGRSSKHIRIQRGNYFTVVNEIDNSYDDYRTVEEMLNLNEFIRKAFDNEAFGIYGYEIKRFKEIL